MRINVKERDKKERQARGPQNGKGLEVERMKPPTTTRAIDALIGDEEKNGKLKEE